MLTLAQSALLVVAGLVGAVVDDPSTGVTATLSFRGVSDQASAAPDTPVTLKPGADLVLDVRITNGSEETWSAPKPWLFHPVSFPVHDSVGTKLQFWSPTIDWLPDAKLTVEAGETTAFGIDLLRFSPPSTGPGLGVDSLYCPGRYTAQMVLRRPTTARERGGAYRPPQWKTLLVSNSLTFLMRPFSDQEVDDLLFGIAEADLPEKLRRLNLLGVGRATQAVRRIRALASVDPSAEIRAAALYALGTIGDASVAGAVEALLLADPSPRCRAAAAWALGELALPRSVPVLVTALHRRKEWPKEQDGGRPVEWWSCVLHALGKIGDERALPELREVARRSPHEGDRGAAERAIKEIAARADEQRK